MPKFTQEVTNQVRNLFRELDKIEKAYEKRREQIEEEIESLLIGESVIQPGDEITWTANSKKYTGVVISISTGTYRRNGEFHYRCAMLNSKGIPCGNANVDEDNFPEKVGKWKGAK